MFLGYTICSHTFIKPLQRQGIQQIPIPHNNRYPITPAILNTFLYNAVL